MRRRLRPFDAAALAAVAACAALVVALQPESDHQGSAPPTEAPTASVSAAPGSARELADTLPVRAADEPPDAPPYDADLFGWRRDTDHNGCDTRNDVLRRDLTDPRAKPGTHGCKIETGTLESPYSGARVPFVAGSQSGVDIDHVVAREDAWKSGAHTWTDDRLIAFGNDGLNLLAVESSLNRSHGSRAADEWLPPSDSAHCAYASRQVAVKAKWGLSVTEPERKALVTTLDQCPDGGQVPTDEMAAWPTPDDSR